MQDLSSRSPASREPTLLIVGAGPTGLVLACDLARRGVNVRLIDQRSEPFAGSRGKGIQPRTLEIFEDLGVIERVLAQGAPYPGLRVHTPWFSFPWQLQARARRTVEVPYPNVWLLPQAQTEAILRARLEELGGGVELATELVSFEQDASSVTATLRRRGALEKLRVRYLVGADGGHSLVRKLLGVSFVGRQLAAVKGLVGDVRVDGLDRDHWHVWPWATTGLLSFCPLPHSDLFQLFAELPTSAAVELTERGVDALVRSSLGRARLRVRDPSWLSLYRPNVRSVERYRVGRVFLAGDAAHVHPPTGAQGLNLGVQDAYNLGWKLAAVLSGAREQLLDTYDEERRPVAARVLELSSALFSRKWRQRGAETKQLGTSYRERSLAAELHCAPRRVRAGDRAPDAIVCAGERGTAQRLYDLLRGPHATLLAFGQGALRTALQTSRARELKIVQIGPQNDRLRHTYGAADDDLVIVRPDGYVGLIARAPCVAELNVYLDHLGFGHHGLPLTSVPALDFAGR